MNNSISKPCPRRRFLAAVGLVASGAAAARFWSDRNGAAPGADVFIARADRYEDGAMLVEEVLRGLRELGIDRPRVRGRSVLLKPNLVEPGPEAPHASTNPSVVRAAAEAFRRLDASEVFVAEGPGHIRDTDYVLEASGLGDILDEDRLEFVDLNEDEVFEVPNRLGLARWRRLVLPRSLRRADLVVSLPKLKTHHWVGVTLSLKNLFGVMPGACYGWPKNLLHAQGIEPSILDIAAAVRPHVAIIDGIVGMEGDGPILGTPRRSGLLVMGTDLVATDATATRLMGFDPARVGYLAAASGRLGTIEERRILQRGEPIAALAGRFAPSPNSDLAHLRD